MYRTLTLISVLALASVPVAAQETVPPPDDKENIQPILPPENDDVVDAGDTLDGLFEKLRHDPKASSAGATAKLIWREWTLSGSDSINLLMNWAGTAMRKEDFARAQDFLDQVVVLAPHYAEGWNRRATLYYQMQDFGRSLGDIETTLALEPRHFGALSGLAAILQQTGNDEAALETWYRVLEIYPANKQAQDSVIALEEKLSDSRT
ncbi:MAG: tetratricopeptide repeat protein [Pseudomonadota bacterium]